MDPCCFVAEHRTAFIACCQRAEVPTTDLSDRGGMRLPWRLVLSLRSLWCDGISEGSPSNRNEKKHLRCLRMHPFGASMASVCSSACSMAVRRVSARAGAWLWRRCVCLRCLEESLSSLDALAQSSVEVLTCSVTHLSDGCHLWWTFGYFGAKVPE